MLTFKKSVHLQMRVGTFPFFWFDIRTNNKYIAFTGENNMTKLEEGMQILDELLRKAYSLISPLDMHSDLKWYLDRDMRNAQMEKFPKCFMKMKNKIGRDIPFPICNVSGMADLKMVDFSLKMAERMKDEPDYDQDNIDLVVTQLKRVKARFDKDIPTPAPEAARKANVTKNFNAMSSYLKGLR